MRCYSLYNLTVYRVHRIFMRRKKKMKKYVCSVCGYVYDEAAGDPDNGIAAGTLFEDLPDDFACPLCGVGKDDFVAEENN